MNYQEACNFLNNRESFGIKLGLERISDAARELGNPQDKTEVILIAGTNGKGSTARAISMLLSQKDKMVGTYLSPHLVSYTERMLINMEEISGDDFAKYISIVIDSGVHDKYSLTTFEIITLASYKYFAEQKVDYAVIEVGLGGRFDATNIAGACCSVITSISMDHTDFLGDTLEKVAREKAGIIKSHKPVYVLSQNQEVLDVISPVANNLYAKMHIVEKHSEVSHECAFQELNLSVAIEVATQFVDIGDKDIELLCKAFVNPGRFEIIQKDPMVIFDGAHNPDAMDKLAKSLIAKYPNKRFHFMLGILKRKDFRDILDSLLNNMVENIETFTCVEVPDQPSWSAAELGMYVRHSEYLGDTYESEDIMPSWKNLLETTPKEDVIVCCGSLFLIGHIKSCSHK